MSSPYRTIDIHKLNSTGLFSSVLFGDMNGSVAELNWQLILKMFITSLVQFHCCSIYTV